MTSSLGDRVWRAAPEQLAMGAALDPRRTVARFGPVVAADLDVPFPWGVRAHAGAGPVPATAAIEALRWCRERGHGHGWSVCVPDTVAVPGPWRGLAVVDELPTFASTPDRLTLDAPVDPDGVSLSASPAHGEVLEAYGGWMSDDELAARLVVPADLTSPHRAFVVASVAARPVGCAFVWWVAGTACLSGIGVVRELRGRGIGRALTVAAARVAVTGAPAGSAPDVVWMHATEEGARLYHRLGFRRVGTERHLSE